MQLSRIAMKQSSMNKLGSDTHSYAYRCLTASVRRNIFSAEAFQLLIDNHMLSVQQRTECFLQCCSSALAMQYCVSIPSNL